ncbi:MAG TPA: hypothetical protein VGK84_12725 [Candidatus Tumulicola sp.]
MVIVEALYQSRLVQYSNSDHTVDADGVTTANIADAIERWIRERRIAI